MFVLNVPAPGIKLPVIVNALFNVHDPVPGLTPNRTSRGKEIPLVSTVLALFEEKVIDPLILVTANNVAGFTQLPATVRLPESPALSVIAPSIAVASKFKQAAEPRVTVNADVPLFELASKNTLSEVVGGDAPP